MTWTPPPEDEIVSAPPAQEWTPPAGDTVLSQPSGNWGTSFRSNLIHTVAQAFGPLGLAINAGSKLRDKITGNEDTDAPPEEAHGILQSAQAGYQGSSGGLLIRGKLPDVVLEPHHAKWWEKLAAGAGGLAGDFPAMAVGGTFAGAAGIETGPGAIALAGAGAFAAPTALREALVTAYTLDQVTSASDFLHRTAISVAKTGGSALVGALTAGTGSVAGKFSTPFVGEGLGKAVGLGAEVGTMTTASAALEGKLPEPEDFLNAAIMVGGLHAAGVVRGKMMEIYRRTGVPPEQVAAAAHADPVLAEELKAPEAEMPSDAKDGVAADILPSAYREMASQRAAEEAFPGGKAQQVLDHPFADVPDIKLPHQLNMKYIDGPQDLKALQSRMSEVYRDEINTARGGTQTFAEIEVKAARQVADMTGVELQKVMEGRKVGDVSNAVELKIRGDMIMESTVEAGSAIKRLADAGLNATEAMKLDALEAIHKSAMIQADTTGAGSELGRALGYLRRIKELRAQGEGIAKLVEMYGDDPALLLEMAQKMDSPQALASFARRVNKAKKWDMLVEGYKAFLVSGPITQTANIIGNTTFMALRPAVDLIAAGIGKVRGSSDRVAFVEPFAGVFGGLQGTVDALKVASAALRDETFTRGGKWERRQAIPGLAGKIIRSPFRALGAADVLFKVMNERTEAYSLAAREAVREGHNPATREFMERVEELAHNPTEDMIGKIEAAGKRFTFEAPLGEKAKAVSNLIRKAHLEMIVPFQMTPTNIFKEMFRMTPAAPLIGEWRAAIAEGGPAAHKALAEMALGTGISALTIALASAGHISGAGDPDRGKNKMSQSAGWQPYSIRIDGTWYSYQRIQPAGTLIGMAADVAEMLEYMTPEEHDKALKMMGTAFANAVTNQTFLQGISNCTAAITSPDRRLARYLQSTVGSAVPTLAAQMAAMIDPYQREVDSIRDAVINRIPVAREGLTPRRDSFGEPIASQERLGGILPFATREQSNDPVRTEAARLGIGAEAAPRSIQMPAAGIRDLGEVELTPEQRDVFGDVAGHVAYRILDPIVNNPRWAHQNEIYQRKTYEVAFAEGNKIGKMAALTDEERHQKIREIAAGISQRMSVVK